LLDDEALVDVVERLQARISGLGPLEPLLADPTLTELMVNGDGRVWIERRGRLSVTGLVLDEDTVLHVIERIVAPLGRRVDRSSPVVDARLPDGSRVNAIVRPVAVDGPCLTVRRFGARALPLAAFAGAEVEALLRWAVAARWNILVSGGTGSGKTTLLNALAGAIHPGSRLITVEDTAELRLASDHVVRLEARGANGDGSGSFTIRDLVRNALRMRPDRIIVGEVRGPGARYLQAMNTDTRFDVHRSRNSADGAASDRDHGADGLDRAPARGGAGAGARGGRPGGAHRGRVRAVDAAHEVHRAEAHGLRTVPLVERGVVVATPTRPTRRPGGRGFAGAAEPS
jgi:type IV secretory pathway ATPase VirB11/archaellum biosynthesis ATPase